MMPTYSPGDILLGQCWHFNIKAGDIVVAIVQKMPIIKRIGAIDGSKLIILGDNSDASTDSRNYGPIDHDMVRSKIIIRLIQTAKS